MQSDDLFNIPIEFTSDKLELYEINLGGVVKFRLLRFKLINRLLSIYLTRH